MTAERDVFRPSRGSRRDAALIPADHLHNTSLSLMTAKRPTLHRAIQ